VLTKQFPHDVDVVICYWAWWTGQKDGIEEEESSKVCIILEEQRLIVLEIGNNLTNNPYDTTHKLG
jgi:hypothetical protein